jgi:hypothetical protein
VGNYRVEPPGLFRGRGEHPKMGMVKKRVYPRDITINISKVRHWRGAGRLAGLGAACRRLETGFWGAAWGLPAALPGLPALKGPQGRPCGWALGAAAAWALRCPKQSPPPYFPPAAQGASVPEHPYPGQKWKEVRHDQSVTWLAFWKDTVNPSSYKYVWLGATSSFKADSDLAKYEKVGTAPRGGGLAAGAVLPRAPSCLG